MKLFSLNDYNIFPQDFQGSWETGNKLFCVVTKMYNNTCFVFALKSDSEQLR